MSIAIRVLYTLSLLIYLPFGLIKMGVRNLTDRTGHRKAGRKRRILERFGVPFGEVPQNGVVFHSVSVGETIAAISLIERFLAQNPGTPVTVTCTTQTASKIITQRLGKKVFHYYLPFDIPLFVGGFLSQLKPRALIILETELWPNLVYACHVRNIRLLVLNARLSQKSFEGYRVFAPAVRQMLDQLTFVCCQTEMDRKRFIRLGLPKDKCIVSGNLKFDMEKSEEHRLKAESLDQELFANRIKWIAGSTHDGEEQDVLDAHMELLETMPELLLVLAPRHPSRINSICTMLDKYRMRYALRSSKQAVPPDIHVFVVDTIGELLPFYAMSQICFVGGSLIKHGGHNPLEPAVFKKPIVSGPHIHNFLEIFSKLGEQDATYFVKDGHELYERLLRWFTNPVEANGVGQRAYNYLEIHRGATSRSLNLLNNVVGEQHGDVNGDVSSLYSMEACAGIKAGVSNTASSTPKTVQSKSL